MDCIPNNILCKLADTIAICMRLMQNSFYGYALPFENANMKQRSCIIINKYFGASAIMFEIKMRKQETEHIKLI